MTMYFDGVLKVSGNDDRVMIISSNRRQYPDLYQAGIWMY
jgi:hypothetical protein